MPAKFLLISLFSATVALFACQPAPAPVTPDVPPVSTASEVVTETILTGYEVIWGMDFLPGGDLLFAEKRGRIYRRSGTTVTQLSGLPADINAEVQGGLLDIRVAPNYASTGWVYASYAATTPGTSATRLQLVRFKLDGDRLTNLEPIFRTSATNQWKGHYGSRIDFDKNGLLFLSVGEGGTGSYGGANSSNKNAQNVQTEWGKIHRMTASGGIPADNPILPGNTARTTVYSYGHRNPQGLLVHPVTGAVWSTEHGAKGGDELNLIEAGKNYGWPLVSNGINYDGTAISASPTMSGIEPPRHTWTPSIGPCGMAFSTSTTYKNWTGSLFVGSLALTHLSRLTLADGKVVGEEKLLPGNRVRNVKEGPDGAIYVSVEGPGRIIKLTLK